MFAIAHELNATTEGLEFFYAQRLAKAPPLASWRLAEAGGVLLAGQDDLVDVAKAGVADDGAMMNLLARASRTWSMVPSPGWTIGRLTTR